MTRTEERDKGRKGVGEWHGRDGKWVEVMARNGGMRCYSMRKVREEGRDENK